MLEGDTMHHSYRPLSEGQTCKIAWFSGTGSTKYVGEQLAAALVKRGIETESIEMRHDGANLHEKGPMDFLFILFAVHAFGAPDMVHQWLDKLPEGRQTKVVVLSVSGGGEIWPNTACRNQVIRMLERKFYDVIYERMLVMPCNMLFESDPDFLGRILQMLPLKIEDILMELKNTVTRRNPFRVSQILLNPISAMERNGVKKGSRNFIVLDSCTQCGLCMKACPAGNIQEDRSGRPLFRENCLMCLKCIYGCPVQAIKMPKYEKWLVSVYDMEVFKKYLSHEPVKSIDECCKGLVWLGVKRYLKDIKY